MHVVRCEKPGKRGRSRLFSVASGPSMDHFNEIYPLRRQRRHMKRELLCHVHVSSRSPQLPQSLITTELLSSCHHTTVSFACPLSSRSEAVPSQRAGVPPFTTRHSTRTELH
ncbi:hypothetical protein B0O80DRAFT_48591 [Mortierella sp. GBAus27b]|nr:hypothetical protein B0O80DRAFT_48591 [Mortierella sp. GBAus27b]